MTTNLPIDRYTVDMRFQMNAISGDHAEGYVRALAEKSPDMLKAFLFGISATKIPMRIAGMTLEKAEEILNEPRTTSDPDELKHTLVLPPLTTRQLQILVALTYIQMEQLKADKGGDMDEEIAILELVMGSASQLLPPTEEEAG
jgi:hypothetical protein